MDHPLEADPVSNELMERGDAIGRCWLVRSHISTQGIGSELVFSCEFTIQKLRIHKFAVLARETSSSCYRTIICEFTFFWVNCRLLVSNFTTSACPATCPSPLLPVS